MGRHDQHTVGRAAGAVEIALSYLPAIEREVVLLHDVDGRTDDEIAVIVGTSIGMCRIDVRVAPAIGMLAGWLPKLEKPNVKR